MITVATSTVHAAGMSRPERGVALLAVLFALTLLMLLALPFAVSMSVGAEASARDVEQVVAEQGSASVRDFLLSGAAMSDPAIDATPMYDSLDEFPDHVDLPKAFQDLQDGGRALLAGEITDEQRYLGLDSTSPLLLANVIHTATRLGKDLAENATECEVEDASALPDTGFLWLQNEVVRYGQKNGNQLAGLERGMFKDQGFADGKQAIGEGALVLDYRCVIAAAWPFAGRGDKARRQRHPYQSVGELLEIGSAGIGNFTAAELDAMAEVFSTDTMAVRSATWGRPERLFAAMAAGQSNTLVVRSALHVGAGSTVRIRNQKTGDLEYGLVMASETQKGQSELQLPQVFLLHLLLPVLQAFPAGDSVVEPLVPSPVNINTASVEVLTALLEQVGKAASVEVHDPKGRATMAPMWIHRSDAQAFAEQVVTLRGAGNNQSQPFEGSKDLVERMFKPRFEGANDHDKQRWMSLYRNLQTGRDSTLAMGTAPICFDSGPWVHYRAADSLSRSTVAPAVVARSERTGSAAALPGFMVERRWSTQEQFEQAFLLDRRAPYWTTDPINLGAPPFGELGNDPAPRYFPHIVPIAYPDLGLGEPRYGSQDEADSAFQPAPSTSPSVPWSKAAQAVSHSFDSFSMALDVRGHDVRKQGAYLISNSAKLAGAGGAASGGSNSGGSNRHDRISFPFSDGNGFCQRFATSFWLEPDSLGSSVLYDYGDGDADKSRMALLVRDGKLVFEVVDEAGIDPNPSDSPAGVERTASQWQLPLAELALPPSTPVHLSFSADSGRPSDLSFAVDGMTRGKAKYVTWLTAGIPEFDPTLANNNTPPGTPGNDSYLNLTVDSTEGFPPVGVLRIGLELFEYTGIKGNTFECQFRDSFGGRGARMLGREMRPNIPTGPDGKPTVDINDPKFQGANLDIFPEHKAGSLVELYGYSSLLSEDKAMMVGATQLNGAIGGFAVARAYVQNQRDITITPAQGPPFRIGAGIDETWTGDIQLADPLPLGRQGQNKPAQASITDAFATTGGYALLVQDKQRWDKSAATTSASAEFGGVELIRYTSRQGNKLTGVQRTQQLPGQDGQINSEFYDGKARRFVTDFDPYALPNQPQVYWDDIPTWITWVVPVSISVQSTKVLWDPQSTGLTEWVQLYPKGGDESDTEWVRYDNIAQNKYLVRANRAAWASLYFQLTRSVRTSVVTVGPLGPTTAPTVSTTPPWGTVTPTSGYIGYTPRLESDFPQIRAARYALRFRGDPMPDFFEPGTRASGVNSHATSSHPQSNSQVTQVHRMDMRYWGNYSALTGRLGRQDRIAVVQGSAGKGKHPVAEWHTVNWSARRFTSDVLAKGQEAPTERLGPWPFQLVAFKDAVQNGFIGPPAGTVVTEPRQYDRIVKFPSGELPAAYCEAASVGAGIGNVQPVPGIVDELDVISQFTGICVLDEACTESAKEFAVNPAYTVNAMGAEWSQTVVTASFPTGGGLCLIDSEIVAYQSFADGRFSIATNGRGLLNTEPRAHDRGARVHFLAHRPMAILSGSVSNRDATLPVQDAGALPRYGGTLLMGRELLHYTWMRSSGSTAQLEMPKWYPPGGDRDESQSRGLFRGRYGTTVQGASSGEPVIAFPFRYWDRYHESSDDPELAYFQLTTNEAPVFFRTLRWREETKDPRVAVVCLARTDSHAPWQTGVGTVPDLWQFVGGTKDGEPHRIGRNASRFEVRFATRYSPGAVDLESFSAHGWKTTARVEDVRLQYEGQTRILDERVTAR